MEAYYRDVALYMSERNQSQNVFIEKETQRKIRLERQINHSKNKQNTTRNNHFDKR